jgi:hypothetical protein
MMPSTVAFAIAIKPRFLRCFEASKSSGGDSMPRSQEGVSRFWPLSALIAI